MASPGGLIGQEYLTNLQKFLNLNNNQDHGLFVRHLEKVIQHVWTNQSVELGFNGQWEFNVNGTYIYLVLQDMFSCSETIRIDTWKNIQFNISLTSDGIFGCASKKGQSVLFELTQDNKVRLNAMGGGNKLQIAFNSTNVECWSGSVKKVVSGIVTCQSAFGGTINVDMSVQDGSDKKPSKLSTGAIVGIVIGVLVLLCAIILVTVLCCQKC